MGSRTLLDIETDKLASAASKASATMAASVTTITPPPPASTSQLDIALAAMSVVCETLRGKLDANDAAWATKQQASLATSPPLLAQQERENTTAMQKHIPTFPMPAAKSAAPGTVYHI